MMLPARLGTRGPASCADWHADCKLSARSTPDSRRRTTVPEFMNPFSGLTPDRKMTSRELARAIRMALAAEEEAVHLYEAMADAADDRLAAKVLQDIADEERVHAGEFQKLLTILLPDEQEHLEHGAKEVEEMQEELGSVRPAGRQA
jgi:rubrerythrin